MTKSNIDSTPTLVEIQRPTTCRACLVVGVFLSLCAGASLVGHYMALLAAREASATCKAVVSTVTADCASVSAAASAMCTPDVAAQKELLDALVKAARRPCPKTTLPDSMRLTSEDF